MSVKLLYQVPKGTWVKVVHTKEVIFFDHIDGMYSYCKDINGDVTHYSSWTEVEEIENETN